MQGCPPPPLLRPPPLLVASERGGLTRYGQGRHPLGTSTHAFASQGRGLARRGALCWAPAAEWGVPRNSEFTNQPLVPHGWDQVKASESGRCLPGLHVESRVLGWERPRQKSPQAFALTRRESQGETGHNQKRENVRQLRAKVRCDRSRSLEGRAGRGPGAPSLGRSPHCPRPAVPGPGLPPSLRSVGPTAQPPCLTQLQVQSLLPTGYLPGLSSSLPSRLAHERTHRPPAWRLGDGRGVPKAHSP